MILVFLQYDENVDENLLERPSSGGNTNCGSSNSVIRKARMPSGSADTVAAASSIHQLSNTLKKSDLNVSLMHMSE